MAVKGTASMTLASHFITKGSSSTIKSRASFMVLYIFQLPTMSGVLPINSLTRSSYHTQAFTSKASITMQEILSVTELTAAIKKQLESRFLSVSVKGEVSNFKEQSSGHLYFTLKDAGAQI